MCFLYNQIFSWLPLASLIDGKIYVVHGGISDRTMLSDLLKIKREKYVSILKPPILNEYGEIESNISTNDLLEWRQVRIYIEYRVRLWRLKTVLFFEIGFGRGLERSEAGKRCQGEYFPWRRMFFRV